MRRYCRAPSASWSVNRSLFLLRHGRNLHAASIRASEAIGTASKLPEAGPDPALNARQHLTVRDILEHRAKTGQLVAGTAAYSDSDMFKIKPASGKPHARRWDGHLTRESLSREACVLKSAAKHLAKPGLISLGGGLPCPENFPIESLSLKVPTVPRFSEAETKGSGKHLHIGKYEASPSADSADRKTFDLAIALNYGQANGSAQLVRWVTEHTELVCAPPYADWRSCLTIGSTGALEAALRMFCDAARGDALLTEEYSFSTALETALPQGVRVFGVRMDEQGLLPEDMDRLLSGWDAGERGGARKPHLLYTVPSGQNPTGATQGEQRRRDLYAVAQKHDLFILEDEPYYFLQMPPYERDGQISSSSSSSSSSSTANDGTANVDAFLRSLIPSLLSMDVDGRVLRMDSFSKVMVPGARLGWVTGSAQVVERYIRHAEVASQGPSGFSQAALHALLDDDSPGGWGHEGYLRWLMHLRGEYARRRDTMLRACEQFLPAEIVSWQPPRAGMFHWLKVDHIRHPDAAQRGILAIEEDIFNACIEQGVLVGRGSWFRAEHNRPPTDLFFRATYAAASPDKMAEAIRRLGIAIRKCYRTE